MIHSLRIQIQLTLAQGENVKKVKLIFCHVLVTQLEEQSTNDPKFEDLNPAAIGRG
jgi:hypothetical protein